MCKEILVVTVIFGCISFCLSSGVKTNSTSRFIRETVSGWGEECNHSAECSDHRYVCSFDVYDNVSRCVCDRFHVWAGVAVGCVQKYNYSTILNMTVVVRHIAEAIEAESQRIFKAQAIAGLFIIATVFLCVLTVSSFCIIIRRSDFVLKQSVKKMQNDAKKSTPSCSTV